MRALSRFGVNELLVGTGDGLQLFEMVSTPSSSKLHPVLRNSWQREEGLPNNFITAIEAQNEQVAWVATGIGLVKLLRTSSGFELDPIDPELIAPMEMIFAIYNEGNYVWFAADRGLLIYDKVQDELLRVESRKWASIRQDIWCYR